MTVTIQEKIETLEAMVEKGILESEYSDGTRLKYRSMDDLFKAIQYFRNQLATGKASGLKNRTLRVSWD